MGDRSDFSTIPMVRSPFTDMATLYVWERYPGGIGFSRKIFDSFDNILTAAKELLLQCECDNGCPSCVGPQVEVGEKGKQNVGKLLKELSG